MAIVRSIAVGKARKSAGDATFATIRGRVIMKQRIFENRSKTPAQVTQRNDFKIASAVSRGLLDLARLSEKTKYGSSFNRFMKGQFAEIMAANETKTGALNAVPGVAAYQYMLYFIENGKTGAQYKEVAVPFIFGRAAAMKVAFASASSTLTFVVPYDVTYNNVDVEMMKYSVINKQSIVPLSRLSFPVMRKGEIVDNMKNDATITNFELEIDITESFPTDSFVFATVVIDGIPCDSYFMVYNHNVTSGGGGGGGEIEPEQ